MFKNIILTGFMGVGKTSVGTRLAKDLGFTFVDTDELIEADQKITITGIFSAFGSLIFRDVETRIIKTGPGERESGDLHRRRRRHSRREPQRLQENGVTICLTAHPESIYDRIKHETHRPLLQGWTPWRRYASSWTPGSSSTARRISSSIRRSGPWTR